MTLEHNEVGSSKRMLVPQHPDYIFKKILKEGSPNYLHEDKEETISVSKQNTSLRAFYK